MDHLKESIQEWKKSYDDVYKIHIGDREEELQLTFIYRNIGRREYNELIIQDLPQPELEEKICEICVLYPEYDFSSGPAGVAETLSNEIINSSYLMQGQSEIALMQYREEMMHLDFQVDCIIHEAFPYIPIEEISNWTIQKTMYYLSRAEWTLINLRGVPLQYVEPEQQQQAGVQPQENQYDYNFNSTPQPAAQAQPATPEESNQSGELSEAEVLAMLQQNEAKHGRTINPQGNENDNFFPEIGWFKAEEEIKGEFD